MLDLNRAATAGNSLQGLTSLEPKGDGTPPALQSPPVQGFPVLPTHEGVLRCLRSARVSLWPGILRGGFNACWESAPLRNLTEALKPPKLPRAHRNSEKEIYQIVKTFMVTGSAKQNFKMLLLSVEK